MPTVCWPCPRHRARFGYASTSSKTELDLGGADHNVFASAALSDEPNAASIEFAEDVGHCLQHRGRRAFGRRASAASRRAARSRSAWPRACGTASRSRSTARAVNSNCSSMACRRSTPRTIPPRQRQRAQKLQVRLQSAARTGAQGLVRRRSRRTNSHSVPITAWWNPLAPGLRSPRPSAYSAR